MQPPLIAFGGSAGFSAQRRLGSDAPAMLLPTGSLRQLHFITSGRAALQSLLGWVCPLLIPQLGLPCPLSFLCTPAPAVQGTCLQPGLRCCCWPAAWLQARLWLSSRQQTQRWTPWTACKARAGRVDHALEQPVRGAAAARCKPPLLPPAALSWRASGTPLAAPHSTPSSGGAGFTIWPLKEPP